MRALRDWCYRRTALDGLFLACGAIAFMQGVRLHQGLALYTGAVCILGAIMPHGRPR